MHKMDVEVKKKIAWISLHILKFKYIGLFSLILTYMNQMQYHKLTHSIWNKEESPQQWRNLLFY
jgi:hypothetical protein